MSSTAVIVLNVVFAAAVVAGLVYVCRTPYRLGRDLPARRVREVAASEQPSGERLAA